MQQCPKLAAGVPGGLTTSFGSCAEPPRSTVWGKSFVDAERVSCIERNTRMRNRGAAKHFDI